MPGPKVGFDPQGQLRSGRGQERSIPDCLKCLDKEGVLRVDRHEGTLQRVAVRYPRSM
jgi:hypothetical protein